MASALTSPRPKRHCRTRSALELLSGADLPELEPSYRRGGQGAGQGEPSGRAVKEVVAKNSSPVKARRLPAAPEIKKPASKAVAPILVASESEGELPADDEEDAEGASRIQEHLVDPKMLEVLATIKPNENLNIHFTAVNKRGGKQWMKCNHCAVSLLARREFVKHLRVHDLRYNPWKCTLCPFSAVFRSSLAVHLNVHAEKKPFACELCGRGFAYKQKLKLHMKYHDDIRDEICPHCGLAFHEQKTLKGHIKNRHSVVVAAPAEECVSLSVVPAVAGDQHVAVHAKDEPPEEGLLLVPSENDACDVTSVQIANAQSDPLHSSCIANIELEMVEAKDVANLAEGDDTVAITVADVTGAVDAPELATGDDVGVAASGEESIVVDVQACYTHEDEEADIPTAEEMPAAVTEGVEDEQVDASDGGESRELAANKLFPSTLFDTAAETEQSGVMQTASGEAPAINSCGEKDMLAEHEIVLQITRVDQNGKDFLGTRLTQKANTVLISLPVDAASSKSIGGKRPKAPVIIGTTKTIKRTNEFRKSQGLSPLGTPSTAVVADDIGSISETAGVMDANAGDDGGGSSSDSGGKAGGKMEIDDVLLEYCNVDDGTNSEKPGKKPTINCKFCDYPFRSQTSFTNHLRKTHADMNIKPYKCHLCDYRAALKGNLEQHIKFHAQERPFTCPVCSKGFIQKYKLDLHLKFHENRREYKCDKCGSAFNDKQDLSRHNKNVHFPIATAVVCDICGKAFKNIRNLDMHTHVHTGAKEFSCEVCGKQYSTRESLRSHMKGHQFQFGCEICAKPLGSYSAFIAHKRLHDPNQKGYECDECGKVLLFRATLEAHKLNVHSTERPFKCEQCPKAFKTKGQLQNHVIAHSKDKPYTCDVCGYSVKRRDSLRLHMYRHASVKPYRCGRCGKEYTQKQALEIHLKAKHAGITTFNCPNCEKGFNTNYLLKKHMLKAHNLEVSSITQPGSSSDQVIIAKQEDPVEEAEAAAAVKKQTVLINAHICEHCNEVFVSQHALAVHILTDHMNQKWIGNETGVTVATSAAATSVAGEDGQVVSIAETIEIPIGEEMLIVQAAHSSADALPDTAQQDLADKASSPSAASMPMDDDSERLDKVVSS